MKYDYRQYISKILLICFFSFISTLSNASENTSEKSLSTQSCSIKWAFGVITGPESSRRLKEVKSKQKLKFEKLVEILGQEKVAALFNDPVKLKEQYTAHRNQIIVKKSDQLVLKKGDKLKMFIELDKQKLCYVYLFYRTGKYDISQLFPNAQHPFSEDSRRGGKYFIPEKNNWFTLDEKAGLNNFYLLVAEHRLLDLEKMVKKYNISLASERRPSAKKLLKIIRKYNNQKRKLEDDVKRAKSIAGNTRAFPEHGMKVNSLEEASSNIDEIMADNIISNSIGYRTFSFDQQ